MVVTSTQILKEPKSLYNEEIAKYMAYVANHLHSHGQNRLEISIENSPVRLSFQIDDLSHQSMSSSPILLITLPKSGSIFIWDKLTKLLKMKKTRISGSYFPDDLIMRPWIEKMSTTSVISQTHIPAKRINLNLIQEFLDRMVFHVRDPRQSILSWVHFLHSQYSSVGEHLLLTQDPPLPKQYFQWSFEKRLHEHIENHFHYWVQWIVDWVEVLQSPHFKTKTLITKHRDLKEDGVQFFKNILHFYDIDSQDFQFDFCKPQQGTLHFRKGLSNEWKTVFSKKQIQQTTNAIPKKVLDLFEWDY